MHKPLDGIRVLEWGTFYAAPGGAAILTDLGAETIKIEQPVTGDPFRRTERVAQEMQGFSEVLFLSANRGKRSITIDLAHPEARQIAYNLVQKSDVFLTNLRRSTIKKVHMDYPSLAKVNPKLIYASVTAYGTQGPDSNRGGFDPQGQARSGIMYGRNGRDEPKLVPVVGIIDHTSAIMASYQIVIALFMRERLGIGQEIDVSLLGTSAYLRYIDNIHASFTGEGLPGVDHSVDPLGNHYRCQDGRWLILRLHEGQWPTICRLLGHPELSSDPRFDSSERRSASSAELVAIFETAFGTRPRDEWLQRLAQTDLAVCAVNTPSEAFSDPQMVENGYVVPLDQPDGKTLMVPGFPIRFSKAQVGNSMIAPKLGEHTDEILREIGGYDDQEIARFREENLV